MAAAGRGRARWRRMACLAAMAFVASGAPLFGAEKETAVRLHGVGSGRFEVMAEPGADGVRLAELAAGAWTEWSAPLGLPSRLPMAIMVRLVPEASWEPGGAPWRVTVEPTGLVSVWIRGGGEAGPARERRWLSALAEGVLRRKAIIAGIAPDKAKTPAWLSAAAAEAMVVAERPAMLDAWQAAAFGEDGGETSLRAVLLWTDHGAGETRDRPWHAAFGVWLWLREASGRSGAWERFVAAVLGGESPGAALAREYGRLVPRPTEPREWELAWQVARARLVQARTTPMMGVAESRAWLERMARVVVLDLQSGTEQIVPAWGYWGDRGEIWLREERAERARALAINFNRLHPFYRNAAGSLGRAWAALAEGREAEWREASVEWTQDLEAGRGLEEASRQLLDEAGGG